MIPQIPITHHPDVCLNVCFDGRGKDIWTRYMNNCYCIYETPFGMITVVSDGENITHIQPEHTLKPICEVKPDNLTEMAAKQLDEYFTGKRKVFDIPLKPRGTPFQISVWEALQNIPYGETRSYKQIAQAIGNPYAYRAVGLANNKNPIMIAIPCHRVIGASGSLTGYRWGIDMKKSLLELEGREDNI